MKAINLNLIRDTLWNYPETLRLFHQKTRPVGIILFMLLFSFILTQAVRFPYFPVVSGGGEKGTFTEGVVGSVSTYNPIYLTGSDIDRSLYELIYTRLIEIDKSGNPQPALAEKWERIDDGTAIRFTLSDDYIWHDGEKVTAEDVSFTILKAIALSAEGQDTIGYGLSGVKVEVESDYQIVLRFEEYVASVYEVLSVFIAPEHVLAEISSENQYDWGRDLLPVGSGKYRVVERTASSVNLARVSDQAAGDIEFINILFFSDVDNLIVAFRNNLLDAIAQLPEFEENLGSEYPSFMTLTIPIQQRKKMLYFNLRNSKLEEIGVRKAVSQSIDREKLKERIVDVYSTSNSFLPANSWGMPVMDFPYDYSAEKAKESLSEAGYKVDEEDGLLKNGDGEQLNISVAYLDNSMNLQIVDELKKMLSESGINLMPIAVSYNSLVNEVLATRNFEMLILELEVTADPDQYNLWHSTKTSYPDLNISGYEYARVDILLERARAEPDQSKRKADYHQVFRFLTNDLPAIVLYEPSYSYIITGDIEGVSLNEVDFPYERYDSILEWKSDK